MRPTWKRTADASARYFDSAERAEALQDATPNSPNAFYFHAQALGRYAQEISIAKALAQGIGDKVKASLDKTIKLEPRHAEAHIALGAYHAEIVSKVGGMLAGLTYGASREEAIRHFALARKLLQLRDRSYRGGERPRHAVRQRETRGGAEAVWRSRSLRPSRRDAEARRGAREGGGVTACGVPFGTQGESQDEDGGRCAAGSRRIRCDGNKAVICERSDATRRAPGRAAEGNPNPRRLSRCFASGSMRGVWKRSHGRAAKAPPDERGGKRICPA